MTVSFLRQLVGLVLVGLAGVAPVTAQTDARLIGSWEVLRVLDDNGEDDTKRGEGAVMTFLDDGTLAVRFTDGDGMPVGEEVQTSYRVEGDALVVQDTDGAERSLFYRFEGDTLVLTPEGGAKQVAYLHRTISAQ